MLLLIILVILKNSFYFHFNFIFYYLFAFKENLKQQFYCVYEQSAAIYDAHLLCIQSPIGSLGRASNIGQISYPLQYHC